MEGRKYPKIIFHIDVNSAFLSWEAAAKKALDPNALDLRIVPSIVGGDIDKRRGIVLAKSVPAKKYGIKTGETIGSAKKKCPSLIIVSPTYGLYIKMSSMFIDLVKKYSADVEQYSVDECFIDITNVKNYLSNPIDIANEIRKRIFNQLGFTVNIGISSNKFLAKMASDFEKPNMTHTLFPYEIKEKMWPLDISEMFMIGKNTAAELRSIGINTIGDIANFDKAKLLTKFKSVKGNMLYNYANGIDNSSVKRAERKEKSLSNSTTLPSDVYTYKDALCAILYICEKLSTRLRQKQVCGSNITLIYKTADFLCRSAGMHTSLPTCNAHEIFFYAQTLFKSLWQAEPIRHVGVYIGELIDMRSMQISFFEDEKRVRLNKIDSTLDSINLDFGSDTIKRCAFINKNYSHIRNTNPNEGELPMMNNYL